MTRASPLNVADRRAADPNMVDLKVRRPEHLKECAPHVVRSEHPGQIMGATPTTRCMTVTFRIGRGSPAARYQEKVGNLGDRADAFYGRTFAG